MTFWAVLTVVFSNLLICVSLWSTHNPSLWQEMNHWRSEFFSSSSLSEPFLFICWPPTSREQHERIVLCVFTRSCCETLSLQKHRKRKVFWIVDNTHSAYAPTQDVHTHTLARLICIYRNRSVKEINSFNQISSFILIKQSSRQRNANMPEWWTSIRNEISAAVCQSPPIRANELCHLSAGEPRWTSGAEGQD